MQSTEDLEEIVKQREEVLGRASQDEGVSSESDTKERKKKKKSLAPKNDARNGFNGGRGGHGKTYQTRSIKDHFRKQQDNLVATSRKCNN